MLKRKIKPEAKETRTLSVSELSKSETIDYEIVASFQTDPGCVREMNEDNGRFIRPSDPELISSKGMLAIVCDGMGGHSAGEVASGMAVELIPGHYYRSGESPALALKRAVEEANREIHAASQANSATNGMGTTCTALAVCNGLAYAAHVGDSRMYLVRDAAIHLLTQDHSAVMEMVKRGILTMEEARHHEDKNVILRALGTQAEVEVDVWDKPFAVHLGDRFLLCSDGLYDLIEDDEIRQALVEATDIYEAGAQLIELAKERGGHDNITAGILEIKSTESTETAHRLPVTRELEVSSL